MATYAQNIDTSGVDGSFSIFNWKPLPGLKWMQCNWHFSIYAAFIYVLIVFSIQRKMKSRDPFKLRSCLAVWNSSLAVFSILGSYFMLPEMTDILSHSFHRSVCYASVEEIAQYWMWLFAVSKVVELGDTVFIVLRKKRLIFLHWFHHVLVLVYTWYAVSQNISLGRWFVTMNYVVHSLMYSYYALRALQYRIPRVVAMTITSLQIVQMVLGFYTSFYTFRAKLSGVYCEIPMKTATFGFLVYIAFLYLFARFFVKTYILRRKGNSIQSVNNQVPNVNDNIREMSLAPKTD